MIDLDKSSELQGLKLIEVLPELAEIEQSSWVDETRKLLEHNDPAIRGRAILVLALIHRETESPLNTVEYQRNFWHTIRHSLVGHTLDSAIQRWEPLVPLASLICTEDTNIEQIVNLIQPDTNLLLSQAALYILSQLDLAKAAQLAISLIHHSNNDIRRAAVQLLGKNNDQKFVPLLISILNTDTDMGVIESAAVALSSMSCKDGLRETIEKSHETAAAAAFNALVMHHASYLDGYFLSRVLNTRTADYVLLNQIKHFVVTNSIVLPEFVKIAPDVYEKRALELINGDIFRILVVEDELRIFHFIQRGIAHEGYKIDGAHDGYTALAKVRNYLPDLILLDWMLPGIDGLEVCKWIRATSEIPIIMLTGKDDVVDRLMALDAGADDFLVKPFSIDELIVRVRTMLLRSYPKPGPAILHFADLTLDAGTHLAYRGGRVIDLTAKEYEFLELFMRNPNQVLTRDVIYDRVWGYDFEGKSNIIEVYVGYLRKKMEEANESRLIHTVRGMGYVLREA